MFSWAFLQFLIVLLVSLVLFCGMALLALRRRNEILQEFLTPDNPNIEQEFFKKRPPKEEPTPEATDAEVEPGEEDPMRNAVWGTQES